MDADDKHKVQEFLEANPDLHHIWKDAGLLHVYVEERRLRLSLDLFDNCTGPGLRTAVDEIARWPRRLRKWQGRATTFGPMQLARRLAHENKAGVSYPALARRLNREVVSDLQGASDKESPGAVLAKWLMEAMNVPEADIPGWIAGFLEKLKEIRNLERQNAIRHEMAERKRQKLADDGPDPRKGPPITEQMVRSRIRAFRDNVPRKPRGGENMPGSCQ